MRREDVLEYAARRRIYSLIHTEPGLHLREIERRSGMPLSTLRHHIRYLEEHHLIEGVEDKNVVRYFSSAIPEGADRLAMGALRQDALRRVMVYILSHGGSATYRELLDDLKVPQSTLATYLAQLTKRGLLDRRSLGRESRYDAREPERVVRLLHTYRTSLLDRLVDHLLDVVYQDEPDGDA